MNHDLLNTFILAGAFFLLFGLSEVLFYRFEIKAEYTRKLVHLMTGLLTLLFPIMLGNHLLVLLLCSAFGLLLMLSIKFRFLKSINAVDRETIGSLTFPIAIYVCYLTFEFFDHRYVYFYLPILILAVCDPCASLVGSAWPIGKFRINGGHKTLMGSAIFFLTAFLIATSFYYMFGGNYGLSAIIIKGLVIALIGTISEAVCTKGYDNIFIPLSVIAGILITEQIF